MTVAEQAYVNTQELMQSYVIKLTPNLFFLGGGEIGEKNEQ